VEEFLPKSTKSSTFKRWILKKRGTNQIEYNQSSNGTRNNINR
jgi:hypothetical protein